MQNSKQNFILQYITTPFCGVCKSAKPMVKILAEALELRMEELDANHHASILHENKITQVPAIMIRNIQTNLVVFQTVQLTDVVTLYNRIIPLLK